MMEGAKRGSREEPLWAQTRGGAAQGLAAPPVLWGPTAPFASFSSRTPSSRNLSHREDLTKGYSRLCGAENTREKELSGGQESAGKFPPEGEIDAIAIVIERDIISIIIIIISTIYTAITTAAPQAAPGNATATRRFLIDDNVPAHTSDDRRSSDELSDPLPPPPVSPPLAGEEDHPGPHPDLKIRVLTRTYIICEGDPVDQMVFIIRGSLESITTDGGRSGFFNRSMLQESDFCGEELLTWVLDPKSGVSLPSYTRTVMALSEVEAFTLHAEELKFVVGQFCRMHNKQVQHTFRFYSQQWRTWAATYIQAAWRRHLKRKAAKLRRKEEE
ncbi:hypothetical protein QYE76_063473 [Lolium multiflorum]|uniref:Cyclic nucleotide-binding domain-containing protein n=1 Tax=Lolium multiflorum TaxID=4521 RepID=A0AAD8S5S0_LOLMU|nr:hypothetical protein QYE76_063473 [Lolium multiflorum]